jgi:hypothetical protein
MSSGVYTQMIELTLLRCLAGCLEAILALTVLGSGQAADGLDVDLEVLGHLTGGQQSRSGSDSIIRAIPRTPLELLHDLRVSLHLRGIHDVWLHSVISFSRYSR